MSEYVSACYAGTNILRPEVVAAFRDHLGHFHAPQIPGEDVTSLCESHEAIRAQLATVMRERDAALAVLREPPETKMIPCDLCNEKGFHRKEGEGCGRCGYRGFKPETQAAANTRAYTAVLAATSDASEATP